MQKRLFLIQKLQILQLLQPFLTADLRERDAECAEYAANAAVKFTVIRSPLKQRSKGFYVVVVVGRHKPFYGGIGGGIDIGNRDP